MPSMSSMVLELICVRVCQELQTRIKALAQRHELSNAARLQKAAKMQVQIQQRLLRLAQHLHLLIPSLRSSSIRPEEEALRAALEEIDEEIRRPGGLSRLQGRLSELWAALNSVIAARQRIGKNGETSQWAVVDDEGLSQIAQVRWVIRFRLYLGHGTNIPSRSSWSNRRALPI
jgi:nuclear pore complex protein Nup54